MAGDEVESAVYQALMAVKPADLSLSEWARRAGINRSIFNGIARHGNPTTQTLDRLLLAIGVEPSRFQERLQPVRTEVRATGMTADEAREAWMLRDAKPVPVLGTAFGSDLAEVEEVETIELMMHEVLDHVARPPSLASDDEAYAVTVVGDSQAPRFEPGELAFVSPKSTVGIGDDVLVQLRAADNEEGSQLAGRVSTVLLKRLVRRTGSFIELRQFNPDKTFRIPLERVSRIHRVRGRL